MLGRYSKFGVIFTPEKEFLLTPSKESKNSENRIIFTPSIGYFYSFWSYFNSEGGVKILGTG